MKVIECGMRTVSSQKVLNGAICLTQVAFSDTVKKYMGKTVYKGSVNAFGQRHGKGKCIWKKGTE